MFSYEKKVLTIQKNYKVNMTHNNNTEKDTMTGSGSNHIER